MGISEGMKSITENIIRANDLRMAALGGLMSDTGKKLKEYSSSRKSMSDKQIESLANYKICLIKDVKNILDNSKDLIKEYRKDHKIVSETQSKKLMEFTGNLNKTVSSMLTGFRKDHSKMSEALKNNLESEIKNIRNDVKIVLAASNNLLGKYHTDMSKAKETWKKMASTLDKSRHGEISPNGHMAKEEKTSKTVVEKKIMKKNTKKHSR